MIIIVLAILELPEILVEIILEGPVWFEFIEIFLS